MIEQVDGNGTCNVLNQYAIEDSILSNASVVYYKLSQTDYDGEVEFLKTISYIPQGPTDIDISLYPTYSENSITIDVSNFSENMDYEIYNMTGQMVKSGMLTQHTNISISDFETGMYIIQIKDEGNIHFRKFVKK